MTFGAMTVVGRLSLANAKNFYDYLKRKRGIIQIDNKDKLCLPRAIVVGRAYIQHFEEKSVSKHEYRSIVGNKKSLVDKQGDLAKDLCAHAGFKVEEYSSKTSGMEEVKVFAQLLAPKYGIAVHNSLTANSKVLKRLPLKTKRLCLGLICSTSITILIPSQSRRDFLERIIGVSSATNAMRINRNTNVFQTASRAKL